ncbi:MAG: hypothetical protein ACLRS7_02350 [Acutalibacter sp.]
MDVQVWQAVLLQNQFEPPEEGAGDLGRWNCGHLGRENWKVPGF